MSTYKNHYMKPLVLNDMLALNDLSTATWAWEIRYWTEKGLDHGSFVLRVQSPKDRTWRTYDGVTIQEAVEKFLTILREDKGKDHEISDYL